MIFTAASLALAIAFPNAAASYSWNQLPSPRKVMHGPAAGWTYLGCYTDTAASRTLLEASTVSSAQMTPYRCTTFCQGANSSAPSGMNFAGVEYTKECFCDFNIQGTAKKVNETLCNSPCTGDASYTCGGAGYISIYRDKGRNGTLPTNRNKVGNWTFDGCFKDNTSVNKTVKRTLSQRTVISSGVTVESCTSQCAAKGFHISGLEFGLECWCGSSFLVANTTAPLGDCSQACKANHSELCGAANRLSVYTSSISV